MRILCLLILTFSLLSHSFSAKHDKKKLSSAMVVGTVYCYRCFNKELAKTNHFHFIAGASVAVECGKMGLKSSFQTEAKTNERGEFKVRLPFAVHEHVQRIKRCQVKLISSNEPFCSVASMATSSSFSLKSRKQGIHIYSSGFFTFKPLKQPELCYQKPNELPNPSAVSDKKPLQPAFFFPPTIPPIFPTPPPFGLPFPPNPFQPPPLLPPLPFIPPPPPLINFPPIPFFTPPPPPPFFNFPPLPSIPPFPFFTPPPPPPPVFPFPPPFHFPPLPPLFPGIPPASPSKKTSP